MSNAPLAPQFDYYLLPISQNLFQIDHKYDSNILFTYVCNF